MKQPAGARVAFLLLAALLTVYHWQLLDRGALAFPDERVSLYGLKAVTALERGDVAGAAGEISGWGARPAENLLRLPAAFLQTYAERNWNIPSLSVPSLRIATPQNVLVSLLLALAFFAASRHLLTERYAAFAAGAFALLSVNHFWIRHVVPYDAALLFHFLALERACRVIPAEPPAGFFKRAFLFGGLLTLMLAAYPLVFYRDKSLGIWVSLALLLVVLLALASIRKAESFKALALCGILSGFALAVYPAYYSFVPLVGACVLVGGKKDQFISITKNSVAGATIFGFATASVVFGFEFIARVGGVSYLGGARLLSSTLNQGDYSEGFVYLFKWLADTDFLATIWLFPLALVGVLVLGLRCVQRLAAPSEILLARVLTGLWALYLVYAAQSAILHRVNFSGRYARMYVPALVLAAAYAVSRIERARVRLAVVAASICLSLGAFAGFARAYSTVGYPVNAVVETGILFEDVPENRRIFESEIVPNYNLPMLPATAGFVMRSRPGDPRFTLVNFGWFDLNGRNYTPFVPDNRDQLVLDRPHFQCFVNSLYEGFPMRRRDDCRTHDFRLRIYERTALP